MATVNDLPEIEALWEALDARLGPQDRPDLFANPVVLTLVAEDARGQIVDAVYGEATIEWTMIGGTRRGAQALPPLVETLKQFCGERVRYARVLVPRGGAEDTLARYMARKLPGLIEVGKLYAHFVCRTAR